MGTEYRDDQNEEGSDDDNSLLGGRRSSGDIDGAQTESVASLTLTMTQGRGDHSEAAVSSCSEGLAGQRREYKSLCQLLEVVRAAWACLLTPGAATDSRLPAVDALLPDHQVTAFRRCSASTTAGSDFCGDWHNKLWKRHYCALLEAVDLVYKDVRVGGGGSPPEVREQSQVQLDELSSRLHLVAGPGADLLTLSAVAPTAAATRVSCALLTQLVAECRVLRGELERQAAVRDRLFHILRTARDQRARLKGYVARLRSDLGMLLAKMRRAHGTTCSLSPAVPVSSSGPPQPQQLGLQLAPAEKTVLVHRVADLERILKEEEARRKRLHNKLQEVMGNIRVFCRLRPHPRPLLCAASEDRLVVLPVQPTAQSEASGGCGRSYSKQRSFVFDRVFGPGTSQQAVFEAVEELIISCVDGYNVCIMAYGQTGSGKTHTMMGSAADPGVNRRAVLRLLAECEARRPAWTFRLFLSMVEIYQEEVRDILCGSSDKSVSSSSGPIPGASGNHSVRIMSNQEDEIMLHGLSQHEVRCERDIFRYFEKGERQRTVGSTLLNVTSSRSHLVVLLKVFGESAVHAGASVGTLTLCDLAGSENVNKSGATGERFCEAACINKSLTALGRVLDSLRRSQRPAYRETKLTHLLRPTLGGDAKCLLFVTLRCEPENAEETLRAVHFGVSAMQVAPEKAQQRARLRKTLGKISV